MKRFAVYINNSTKDFVGYVYAENHLAAFQKAKWDFSYDYPQYNFDKDVVMEEE